MYIATISITHVEHSQSIRGIPTYSYVSIQKPKKFLTDP